MTGPVHSVALTSLHATGIQDAAWLLLALPLAGAAILLLGGKRTNSFGHLIGVAMPVLAFGYAVAAFVQMLGYPAALRSRELIVYQFINVGRFQIPLGLRLDQLSICFVLLITGVGSLIHIFSVGYMANDPERRRFFAYMNLFLAAMLLLVLGSNYLVLYAGWEGVGLASYLLIGFWQYKPAAAVAAKKAFIANRVGDVGLSLAIMLMFAQFGTVTFTGVFRAVPAASHGVVLAIGLLLLLGACGKSAQVPLQSWLLDAMEGPTPVSALIHAATMVTAGVYLIVRSAPIFNLSADARLAVAIVGAVTLLWGAIIGCAKDDIKKALAGSTMSQIGYMMLAAGLGRPATSSRSRTCSRTGSSRPDCSSARARSSTRWTTRSTCAASAAWRKSCPSPSPPSPSVTWRSLACRRCPASSPRIPSSTLHSRQGGMQGALLGTAALLGAGITAFYMTRVMFMTFLGERRWDDKVHPHEAPPIMTSPMIVLAIGSVAAGGFLILGNRLLDFLGPVTGVPPTTHGIWTRAGAAALVLVVIGVAIAWALYGRRDVPVTAPAGNLVTVAARKDLYGDSINEGLLMRPGQWLTRLSVYFDNRGVDGLVNTVAATFGGGSGRLRRLQTGFVRSYALSMLLGAVLLVGALLLVRL